MSRENDRNKFVDLAEKRVSKTLKDIKLIGNLSNRSNYSYTEKDVKKIHQALKKAVEEMKIRFESKGAKEDETFKLGMINTIWALSQDWIKLGELWQTIAAGTEYEVDYKRSIGNGGHWNCG